MTPAASDDAILSATLSRYVNDLAVRVGTLQGAVETAARKERSRRESRIGRVAAAVQSARKSPRGALRAPVRIARAMRAASSGRRQPVSERPSQSHRVAQPRIRLIPRAPAGRQEAPGDSVARQRRADRLAEALRSGRRLVVAGSLDERTTLGLGRECEVITLSPGGWRDEVTDTIDLLLIEPTRRRAGFDAGARLSGQVARLAPLIRWCHQHDIPTAIWNTCDPFDRAFCEPIARMVDHVFTGELEAVGWYAERLRHDRIHVCPVATQPLLHNPVSWAGRTKPAAAITGTYDAACEPRVRDIDTVIKGALRVLPVEILPASMDGPAAGDAAWPERYADLMAGGPPLTPGRDACQGYEIALNASTARSSSTVLPRRVLDQLASGIPTVSTFTRGIRVLLGDLVPMSDHADGIETLISELRADRDRFDKRRVMGLRRVLAQHTYRRRLEQITHTIAGVGHDERQRRVCAVAAVGAQAEAMSLAGQLQAQAGVTVTFVLVSDTPGIAVKGARVISTAEATSLTFGELDPGADAFTVASPDHWYGTHYLSGLFDALEYSDAQATTKHARYRHSHSAEVVAAESEYTWVSTTPLDWSRSLVRASAGATARVGAALDPSAPVTSEFRTLAVDRFDFCEAPTEDLDTKRLASELDIDIGRPLEHLTREADRVLAAVLTPPPHAEVDPTCYPTGQIRRPGRGRMVAADCLDGRLIAFSSETERPWYLQIGGGIPREELCDAVSRSISLALDVEVKGGRFGVNVSFEDATGRHLPGLTYYPGSVHRVTIPDRAASVRLAFTMVGDGAALVRSVVMSKEPACLDAVAHLAGSRTLLLTDFYSSYESPYQRSFIHSRVRAYQRFGAPVDVWVQAPGLTYIAHREFDGVDVAMGPPRALRAVLASGAYDTVLVHTMYAPLWNILKDYVDSIRVVAWMHGGELHRWWLDKENPTFLAPREVQIEQIRLDPRFQHWVSVLTDPHPNLRFVFVSQSYLDQANEDLALFGVGFPTGQTVVIPNPVDPERFGYSPKPAEQRTRLMSLRPFHSANYANDLTVAAVVELMSESWFDELDILIAGNGPAFDEITAPLRGVPNVTLEKKFYATQGDIADLYKDRGVLLVPTRRDTQGLSRDEAMCSGLVPISTAIDAVPEFLSNEEGYLTPPEDSKAIADAVRELYHNPVEFERKSAAAAARIRRTLVDEIIIPEEIGTFNEIAPRSLF